MALRGVCDLIVTRILSLCYPSEKTQHLLRFLKNLSSAEPMADLLTVTHLANWLLSPLLGIYTFLFIIRIVLTWYPQADGDRFPFNLVVWPTEFLLVPVRKWVPPFGGVDISPIIWVGIATLLREILLGQQGLLRMLASASTGV